MTLFSTHLSIFSLRKYYSIFEISWSNGFVYRLNFVMWRVRSVIQLLVVYFLWLAIFKEGGTIVGYDRSMILTYVLGTAILRSFVLGSRSQDIGREIASGDLNNFLLRPLNYFGNWLSRDLADKVLNLIFVAIELIILILLLQPSIIIQTQVFYVASFLFASFIALLIYFFLSFLISSITFWYPEHSGWPARFLLFVIIEFLSGGLFPLDIFPKAAFNILRLLPPAYFLFYPLQIYLGRLSIQEVLSTLLIMFSWLAILIFISRLVWHKGLKVYGAYGR
jgi:ABC-2 type transport system permease protein